MEAADLCGDTGEEAASSCSPPSATIFVQPSFNQKNLRVLSCEHCDRLHRTFNTHTIQVRYNMRRQEKSRCFIDQSTS